MKKIIGRILCFFGYHTLVGKQCSKCMLLFGLPDFKNPPAPPPPLVKRRTIKEIKEDGIKYFQWKYSRFRFYEKEGIARTFYLSENNCKLHHCGGAEGIICKVKVILK